MWISFHGAIRSGSLRGRGVNSIRIETLYLRYVKMKLKSKMGIKVFHLGRCDNSENFSAVGGHYRELDECIICTENISN